MTGVKLSNVRQLSEAMREVLRVTKKTEAEVVTKTAKDVAFRASSFTAKTTAARIRRDLTPELLGALAARWLRKKQGKFTKEEHAAAMVKIRNARVKAAGALRVGWFPAIIALGGQIRGSKASSFSHLGSAAKGYGIKATISNLRSIIANLVVTRDYTGRKHGAGEIEPAIAGLTKAIRFVARDRMQYAESKLKQSLKKFA